MFVRTAINILIAIALLSISSTLGADPFAASPGTFQDCKSASLGERSGSIHQAPPAKAVNEFLEDKNLLTLADDFGLESLLFLRDDGAVKFRELFTPECYNRSWAQPVYADKLVLIEGRLYARDFYRLTAHNLTGSTLRDTRPPHEIGVEQWSINTANEKFTLELDLIRNNGKDAKKGIATGLLIDLLLRSNSENFITLYRGVKKREAKLYTDLSSLKQKGELSAARKLIMDHLETYKPEAGSGTFTTPTAQVAASFATASKDPTGAVVVYTIDKEKLASVRNGLYMGIESDYFEISFSSDDARAILFDSVTRVCSANDLNSTDCLRNSKDTP